LSGGLDLDRLHRSDEPRRDRRPTSARANVLLAGERDGRSREIAAAHSGAHCRSRARMSDGRESLVEETWVVTEGAAGMENQCLGLAERLPLPVRTFRIRLRNPWRWLAPYAFRKP